MTTSRQKAIGSQAERDVAARLGGKRIPGYGPVDVEAEPLALQVKCLTRQPSMNLIRAWLAAIPYMVSGLRGVVLIDRPGSGMRARRTIVFDLDEYAEWYGDVDAEGA